MKIGPARIPERIYKQILKLVPVPCTDAVIVRNGKFLLGKRINKPASGKWFLIGGRILRGESLAHSVSRHVRAETGLIVKIKRFLGVQETIFKNSAQGPASHTVNTVFLVAASSLRVFSANAENSEFRWFSKIERSWHPYVKEMLRLAGFK